MPDIGYASMPVIPTFKGLQGDLERGSSKALAAAGVSGGRKFGDAATKSARAKFSSGAKSVVAPLLGAFAAVKVGDFLKDAVSGASDLAESSNKVEQIFGRNSAAVFQFSQTADKALGQTNLQARDAASTFGVFGKAAKLTDRQNAKFSIRLSKLASDLASFSNTSPDQAIEAIGAALRGEAEPIRAYGVLLDDATLKAEALRLGILKPVKDKSKIIGAQARLTESQAKYNDAVKKNGKDSLETLKAQGQLGYAQTALQKATDGTIPALTQQQKVLAAQSSIFRQTKTAQGDFARTSGGLANQQRILAAQYENAQAKLGKKLLPIQLEATRFLNQKGIPTFEHYSDLFVEKGIPAIERFSDKAKPFVKDVLRESRDLLKEAQPYAEGFVTAFNKLPDGVKKGIGGAALLGFGASKLPGGRAATGAAGGAAKGILGLVTKAKPLPVYVVNNGVGGGGLPGGGKGGGTTSALEKGAALAGGIGLGAAGAIATGVGALGYFYATAPKTRAENMAYARKHANDPIKPLTGAFADLQSNVAKSSALGGIFQPKVINPAITRTQALNNEVKLIGSNARTSRAAVASLLDALEAARQRAVKVDQGVSAARASKVDTQLGRGGMYVAQMNVHGTTLSEVRRDASHQHRARAMGSESFRD